MPGVARSEDVNALAARVAEEFVVVRAEVDSNLRLPIALTQAQYDALTPPVAGQIYIIVPE